MDGNSRAPEVTRHGFGLRIGILVVSASLVMLWQTTNLFHATANHLVPYTTDELELKPVEYENLEPLILLKTFGKASCPTTTFTFIREFYQPEHESIERFRELLNATKSTMKHNPCGKFKLILGNPTVVKEINELHTSHSDMIIEAWWSPGGVTFSQLLLAAKDSENAFAISTADTVIAPIGHLLSTCSKAFDPSSPQLFVISRRDLDSGLDCQFYKSNGSWDVYIGLSSMINDKTIRNTVFLPQYWGVENVVARQIFGGTPANLCGYVDVAHLHRVRSERAGMNDRIRINNGGNSVSDSNVNLDPICDVLRLVELHTPAY